ncbi:hypothetical protein [Thermosulfurimonas dismutans]|uniref:Putative lipoprotein n=1 Tax=Thermosulfurimonas dismutans TaxID=999894 RepID=A0A179D7U8_9BACT|nr:hypothetical protein [Thermosulfurimonas dismutans]OAQ21522.1 putative lipoprotein [Thermosulfurimonas dismutans]
MRKKFWLLTFLVWLPLACTHAPRNSEVYPRPKTIAVLPFEAACPGGETGYFTCPVQSIIKGEIVPGASEWMDTLLREKLAGKPGFRFVSRDEFEALWGEVLAEAVAPSRTEIVKALGQALGTEAILYGKVFRFREREGRGYAVKEPASVAFALVLFRSSDGRILWKGWFDETQKPLSENLFKIRLYGGVRWLTAQQLAEKGLERVLSDFPYPEGE